MRTGFFSAVATIYHFDGAAWQRRVLQGVFWRQKNVLHVLDDGTRVHEAEVRVTVPAEAVDGAPAAVGDVMVCGVGPEIGAEYGMAQLRKEDASCCAVCAVADNTGRPRLKHWRIEAK